MQFPSFIDRGKPLTHAEKMQDSTAQRAWYLSIVWKAGRIGKYNRICLYQNGRKKETGETSKST